MIHWLLTARHVVVYTIGSIHPCFLLALSSAARPIFFLLLARVRPHSVLWSLARCWYRLLFGIRSLAPGFVVLLGFLYPYRSRNDLLSAALKVIEKLMGHTTFLK